MAKRTANTKSAKGVCRTLLGHGPVLRGDADVLNAIFPSFAAELEPAGKPRKRSSGKVTQADITRAIKASVKAGQSVSSTRIGADGSITLHHGDEADEPSSEYDRWKSRRDARPS